MNRTFAVSFAILLAIAAASVTVMTGRRHEPARRTTPVDPAHALKITLICGTVEGAGDLRDEDVDIGTWLTVPANRIAFLVVETDELIVRGPAKFRLWRESDGPVLELQSGAAMLDVVRPWELSAGDCIARVDAVVGVEVREKSVRLGVVRGNAQLRLQDRPIDITADEVVDVHEGRVSGSILAEPGPLVEWAERALRERNLLDQVLTRDQVCFVRGRSPAAVTIEAGATQTFPPVNGRVHGRIQGRRGSRVRGPADVIVLAVD